MEAVGEDFCVVRAEAVRVDRAAVGSRLEADLDAGLVEAVGEVAVLPVEGVDGADSQEHYFQDQT